MQPDSHLPESARRLKQARAHLWERAKAGSVGGFAWEYTHLVDHYFEDRVREAGVQRFGFALVAVGGYGRGRLCPGSDIDVLLLFRSRIPSGADAFIKALLYPLWDLGLDLGHGVRTITDCVSLARKDFQVLASLMDGRPLAGDADVFEHFRATFESKVLRKSGATFAESLREHNETRLVQYGDATGMLEPELKNGLGGLRDGQQVAWLSRVLATMGRDPVFLPEELSRLRDDQAFLNRVRTALHLSAGRKTDRLFFDLQPPTARLMGFVPRTDSPEDRGLAVEFFLSRLHQAMTRIKAMREALFQEGFPVKNGRALPTPSYRNVEAGPAGLFFRSQSAVTPDNVLGAFLESARSGLPLTWGARRIVRSNPGRFAGGLVDRSETLSILVEIFLAPFCGVACEGLVETRLLPAIFPEFGDVEHLIQFNDYHVHPVGRHTLATVALLSSFIRGDGEWTGEMASGIKDPVRLILAGFFHDLGKGQPHHSRTGAEIAREVLARYGRKPELIGDVAFLVEHHLLMPKAATRHDLSDERVPSDVAGVAGTRDRLDMLYLLSVADSMATGPRAWNSWTRSLLGELYFKARKLLQHGPLAEPDAARKLADTRQAVLDAARVDGSGLDPDFAEAGMRAMPTRAFFALSPEAIGTHLRLVKRLWDAVAEDRMRKPSSIGGKGVNLIEAAPGKAENTFELTIAAVDQPYLFATLAGAISLHGLNILAADIFTWKDGTVVDVFTVAEPPENLFAEEVWARISRSVHYALTGKLDLAARLEERRLSPLTKGRSAPKLRPLVTVDTGSSDFHTIVEVAATDRTGFLFDMARTLAEHSLSIHLAKITTIKGRAADVFHVRTQDGQRLLDPERIERLRADLLEAASPR
ncbi:[protein-PII] uridylyltransferase [Pseudodesulfovibrio indicus]|uniref:Bifunctional uridylyltransferase/uridylyl-removing enzyme n=1 Tax=Pseudodesulfovibrio indicus TaxID=1716143 RepID=A0A126QJX2_9BACT|nr:[protein-PII] uridylyltransferase [Pseudodesulfovibrio indicus]AMK10323.1 bifunctional uridylyltransferase/uridylyl-removing protein [Pseudodesulfovibrio indicus]TDT81939.1 UTP--GlnB (protein PII) uridylyltransferase GlnD [Pseudodesulfovibrio indicus]